MTIFSANAQSATIIEVSWDLSDVLPGVEPSQLTITQTTPNLPPTAQQFLPPDIDLISETFFKNLSPDTTYTYSIDCVFDNGSEYAPEPGTPATTKSQATGSSGSSGSSGPIITQVPIPPDPITNLVANWIVPHYNEFSETFDLGVDTSSVMVTATELGYRQSDQFSMDILRFVEGNNRIYL